MTRKYVVINMSNWADEGLEVTGNDARKILVKPGQFTVTHGNTNLDDVDSGDPANGYEPPKFPREVINLVEENND